MMKQKEYVCICGKIFTNSQSFNGHKANCKEHQVDKYGSLDNYYKHLKICIDVRRSGYMEYAEKKKEQKTHDYNKWIEEKHTCERCGKVMVEKYGSGRFCSRSCANSRQHTEEEKMKISKGVKNSSKFRVNNLQAHAQNSIEKYNLSPNYCQICGNKLNWSKRNRKTCSKKCYIQLQRNIGIKVATKTHKRSKNEISLCKLCENYFGKENVLHNEPIFNGWDADIILPKYKIAILWNGPWHYRQVTRKHNLRQVQNRDKIKLKEIKKCGYTPYIIKDLIGRYSEEKVKKEFNKVLQFLALS